MFCGQKYRKAGGRGWGGYDIWMIDRNVVSSLFLCLVLSYSVSTPLQTHHPGGQSVAV